MHSPELSLVGARVQRCWSPTGNELRLISARDECETWPSEGAGFPKRQTYTRTTNDLFCHFQTCCRLNVLLITGLTYGPRVHAAQGIVVCGSSSTKHKSNVSSTYNSCFHSGVKLCCNAAYRRTGPAQCHELCLLRWAPSVVPGAWARGREEK